MSTDVGRIDYAAGYCHMGWVAIIQVGFILTILLVNIGPSALAGFGLVIVAGPLLSKAVRKLHQKRRKSTKFTDASPILEIPIGSGILSYFSVELGRQ